MPSFDQIDSNTMPGAAGAQHVLALAGSKMGKSDWVVQACFDGYEVLYIDNDNGFETAKLLLSGAPLEVQKRFHYISPISMIGFTENFVKALGVLRFNERTRDLYNMNSAKPEDRLVELWPLRIRRNVIVSWDSLTSIAFSALLEKSDKMQVDLSDIDKYPREIYGNAGFRVTQVLKVLQLAPFHLIMQAHPVMYEIKEKPSGQTAGSIKEKDMIIVKTLEVPSSTSNVHGETVPKYFNQVGYFSMGAGDKYDLSFETKRGRVSGGTPRSHGDPRTTHRFATLFGKPPAVTDDALPWIRYLTSAEFELERKARAAAAPKLTGGTLGTVAKPATPVNALNALKPPTTK